MSSLGKEGCTLHHPALEVRQQLCTQSSSPSGHTWQIQSVWELPGFTMKAQVSETMLWKQHSMSGPGQLLAVKERGIKGIYICYELFIEAELKQSVPSEDYRTFCLLVTKREKTHLLTVSFKFFSPIFLLLFTLLSSLTQVTPACANSACCLVSFLCNLKKLNVLGLWVLTPHWTSLQMAISQVRAKSLPFQTNKPL